MLPPRRRERDAPPVWRLLKSCFEDCRNSDVWSPPFLYTAGIKLEGPATVTADSDMSSPMSLVAGALDGGGRQPFASGTRLRPASANHLHH